jgi:hypothetical protein
VAKPDGAVQLRCHRFVLFDSYTRVNGPDSDVVVWDLGFGRDLNKRRAVLLNASSPDGLGVDLTSRYDAIFSKAAILFEYRDKEVKVDKLTEVRFDRSQGSR